VILGIWPADQGTGGDQAPLQEDLAVSYLKARFPSAEAWQISAVGRKDHVTPEGIRVSPAIPFLSRLV